MRRDALGYGSLLGLYKCRFLLFLSWYPFSFCASPYVARKPVLRPCALSWYSTFNMSHRTWRKFDRYQILRQKDPWEIARNGFEIALELALLGYIAEATELFVLLESFSSACRSTWSPGLYFAWEATGLWPDTVPAKERTPEALRELETERNLWKRDTNASDEGLDKLITTATNQCKKDAWGNTQLRLPDLTAAVDIASHLNKGEKVLEILQIFADNFYQTWIELPKSRQVWRYLREKSLARAIGVDEEKLLAFKDEVVNTFTERLEKGPRRIFKELPMDDLIKLCNENTIKNAVWEEMGIDPEESLESILHPGATREEIAALEKNLGHELPQDFKEYLSITNGMGSLWNGFSGEPRLLSTDEIRVVDATRQQKDWIEASVDIGIFMKLSVKPKWEDLDHAIIVNDGSEDSTFVWLIDPEFGQRAAVNFYTVLSNLPQNEQESVKKLVGYFYAGAERASHVSWLILVWTPHTLELTAYNSWREYLEYLAGDTANGDILDEEDDKGRLVHSQDIFAYQLRR